MDRTLRITQTYALVSLARSLNALHDRAGLEDSLPAPLSSVVTTG